MLTMKSTVSAISVSLRPETVSRAVSRIASIFLDCDFQQVTLRRALLRLIDLMVELQNGGADEICTW